MYLSKRWFEIILNSFICLLFAVIVLIVEFDISKIKLLFLFNCFICAALIHKCANYVPNFLIAVFMGLYVYFMYSFFILEIPYSYRIRFDLPIYHRTVLLIYAVFFLTLYLTIDGGKSTYDISKAIEIENSPIRFMFAIGAIAAITFLSKSGDNMLEAGNYNMANAIKRMEAPEKGLNLFEYVLIFIPIAFKYANTNVKKAILIFATAAFSIKGLIYGGRIETIQAFSMMMFLFMGRILARYRLLVIFLIVVGVYLTMLFGKIRNNPLFLGNFDASFFNVWETNSLIQFSHHGDVFYASTRLIGMIEEGIIDSTIRMESFFSFWARLIVPVKYLPDFADLSSYLGTLYTTGGGGFIGAFFYVWLSFPGVAGIAFLVGKLMNSVRKEGLAEYQVVVLLIIISTFPRWVAYYPINMFKMPLYAIVVYLMFNYQRIVLRIHSNRPSSLPG